jgi:hypothetical protein
LDTSFWAFALVMCPIYFYQKISPKRIKVIQMWLTIKKGICDQMLLSQLWIDLFVNLQYNERRKNEREKYN